MAVPGDEDEQRGTFRAAFEAAGIKIDHVWMQYFSIGGMSGLVEVQAYVYGALALPPLERDLLAHALNESLDALGVDGRRAGCSREVFKDSGDDPHLE